MENKMHELYKSHYEPPQTALKQITGGRLNGMSDINPQWRIDSLTEMFGICGVGWYYEITKQWIEEGAAGEKAAFVNINLFVKIESEWSKPIFGGGGSSFICKESKGLYTSDECFKMATTDALSVACKCLGIGGAIYSRTKYDNEGNKIPLDKPAQSSQPQDLRPWLNPTNKEKWNEAVKRLKSGSKIESIEKYYKLSKENREKLITESI